MEKFSEIWNTVFEYFGHLLLILMCAGIAMALLGVGFYLLRWGVSGVLP